MRLVLARAAAARTLLVAAGAAAMVTAVLLTAFVLYAQLLPVAGARAAIAGAPAPERALLLTSSANESSEGVQIGRRELADPRVRDAAVRDLFGGGLGGPAGVPLAVSAGGYGVSQRLPDDLPGIDPGRHGAYAVVAFLPDLADHAALTAGAWPEPVPAGEPAQVALPAPVAATMELAVGDEVAIVSERGQPEPAPVAVVGVWEPADPADPYWLLLDARVAGDDRWGPFVVHPDEFTDRYLESATLAWVAVPDPVALADAGPDRVRAGLAGLESGLAHRQAGAGDIDRGARITTGLGELADRLEVATVVNRSGLVLPAALLAVIAGYGLVLVARLLAAHRQGENALLRARGASRRQLVRFTAVEAVLVVAPAAVVAAPVGTWLVGQADANAGARSLGIAADLAGYAPLGPPLAWLVALLAAAGCAAALALPAGGRGRTWVAEQQERSRPRRLAVVQRAGTDLALVGLAVLAWFQLRRYGAAVVPRDAGLGVDPLLVAAPVVGVLAATAVALRLLPVATRLAVRFAGRRHSFAGLLGAWQADRRPHAGPVLLLVLAVATAVLAPAVAATWQQSQRDQAAHQVGADLRLAGDPALAPAAFQLADPGGGIMPVHRTETLISGHRTTLLAVDSGRAPQVARLRTDLTPDGPASLFERLRAGRPELAGVALPAGAQRLTGTVRFEAAGDLTRTVTVEDVDGSTFTYDEDVSLPGGGRLSVHVADAAGVVTTIRLGGIAAGEAHELDVPLPPGAGYLVGLGAGVNTRGWTAPSLYWWSEGTIDAGGEVEASWRWEELAAVDATGAASPLAVPDGWQVHAPDRGAGGPELVAGGAAVTTTLATARDTDLSTAFVLAAAPPAGRPTIPAIPAVVTPDVREAAGAEIGQSFRIGELTLELAGTVTSLPGTDGGSGIVVDLAWLSAQQFWEQRQPPVVTEWWLATGDPTPVAAAARQHGLTVAERGATADRLLGDPLGSGVLLTLWAAAAAAALLAAFGLAVDSRATAVRRARELAVLHTLGTSPPALARSLVVEQAVLAGLGVVAGALVGLGVAVAMGPALVLTPAGAVPVPPPLLAVPPAQLVAPTVGLLAVAVGLGALVARRARREVAAGALRIGED